MTLLELILREQPADLNRPASGHLHWRRRRRARLGYELPDLEAELWSRRVRLPLSPAKKYRQLSDLKRFRGNTWADTPKKKYTLARLTIPGEKPYYGVSAHGQGVHLRVNAISRSHAEGDAFNQAGRHQRKAAYGQLVVDRPLCTACGEKSGVLSMARQIGLRVLDVVQPHLPYTERIYLK